MKRSVLLVFINLFVLLSLTFAADCVFAQQTSADGIVFDAENATIRGYDKKNQVIELKNKIQIIHQGQYIAADEATIDTSHGILHCKGHVRLISAEAKMEADEITLNYKNNTGEISNGFVQVGQVLFEGQTIKKLSESEYQTVEGRFTSCTNCPAFWSFSGSKLDAELGGYAYIKSATVYFGKVPAMWFPYLVVPIKSTRQSGLLFPNFNYSGNTGFVTQESFFWAMSESQDSTWTAGYAGNSGPKGAVNYRYVLSEDSKGSFDFGYMKDRYFSGSPEVLPYNPTAKRLDRYFLKYNHQYNMPYGFIHRMDIKSESDNLYPRDFPEEMPGRGDSSLESRMSLTKNTDSQHWSLDSSYYSSLLTANPLANNSTSVHRFPEMNYDIMPTHIMDSNFLFHLNTNYVNFVRDSKSYDGDGGYVSGDQIRTGQRLDVEPTVSYPINFGESTSLLSSVSYRETRYQFPLGADPSTFRRYIHTNFSLATHFSRIYADPNNATAPRYKHEVQPEVSYSVIPWSVQPDHPFFAGKEFLPNYLRDQPINDNDNIQFDYRDRVFDKNVITGSVTNKILRKRYVQGTPVYDQIIRDKIWQSYDIYESRRNNSTHYPKSEVSNLLQVNLDLFEVNFLFKYFPYQNISSNATRVRVYDSRKDFLQVVYSQDFLLNQSSALQDPNSKTRDITLGTGFNLKYMQVLASSTYDLINKTTQSYQYAILLKPPGNCWSLVFSQQLQLQSIPTFHFNISFLFDGKTDSGFTNANRNIM